MAADLGLVTDAAQRHAHELAAGGARDRLADRGLAGAGRSDQGEDRAGALVLGDPAIDPQLLDRDVLDDPVLDVLEAGVILVQHRAGVRGVEPLLGVLGPRDGDQPVQVGADHARLGALLAHPLEPAQLLLGLLAGVLGHPGLFDLGPVLLDHRGVVLVELLADRLHLLAQEVLALLLLGAGLDVVADPLADLELGQALALVAERQLQALGHVERLQQVDLLLVGEVGGVAGGVGQVAGLGDRAQEGRHAALVAAQLEDLLDHGAVLALEIAGLAVDRNRVGGLFDLDVQPAVGQRLGGAGDSAVQSLKGNGTCAAGEADAVGDLGHRADGCKFLLVTGHQQDALLIAGLDGQRERHAREDDNVVQRDLKEGDSSSLHFR